jgi:hypothetical protein
MVSYPNVVLTAPVAPSVSGVAATNVTDCGLSDGTVTITASSPTSSLEYQLQTLTGWQSSNIFLNVPAGNYTIKVRNTGGACEINAGNITITEPDVPVITSVTPTDPSNCGTADGKICIVATGGAIEYSIDGGINWQKQECFDNLQAGTYNVFVRNCTGTCTVAYTNNPVILDAPNAPTVTATSSTDPTDCGVADGTITVTATGSGSLQYKLDGVTGWQNNNVFSGLSGATYTVLVRNTGGTCEVQGGV